MSIQAQRKATGPPLHDGLRLTPRSRAVRAAGPTVACGFRRKLDASVGAPGPHGFAVRIGTARLRYRLRRTASRANLS